MNDFIKIFIDDEKFIFSVLSFLFLFLFLVFYLIQYIYISYHLKGICKIIFYDEKYFRLPLEPFNCFFISLLPIVFWRETLNIKKGFKFRKLYGKDFYYPINKAKLNEMLTRYYKLFYLQYLIYLFVILFFMFMVVAYILIKYF